jgi:hypothetical protein
VTLGRTLLVAALAAGAALAYLRDPPWLGQLSGGLVAGGVDESGVAYRRMEGHAWFFVPSTVTVVDVPIRLVLTAEEPDPVRLRLTVNDQVQSVVTIGDSRWTDLTIDCTRVPAGGRTYRRIDLYANRVWPGGLTGLQLREIRTMVAPSGALR